MLLTRNLTHESTLSSALFRVHVLGPLCSAAVLIYVLLRIRGEDRCFANSTRVVERVVPENMDTVPSEN